MPETMNSRVRFYDMKKRKFAEARFELTVDSMSIFREMAKRANANKGRKATLMDGAIVVKMLTDPEYD